VGLAAACSSGGEGTAPPAPAAEETTAAEPPPRSRPRTHDVRVVVVDGDTRRPVPEARVAIGAHTVLADLRGVARASLRRRQPLRVRVEASGYGPQEVRLPFQRRQVGVVRVYRPDLQWTMYGVTPERTQAHPEIDVRPPFRIVWSRGVGGLVEFPAVVVEGVAYIGNSKGTITAISMRDGKVVWQYDPPGGKMASSPAVWDGLVVVHGMDGDVRLLDRRTGRLVRTVSIGSPIESSPVVRDGVDFLGTWDGRVVALDLVSGRVRWSAVAGHKITSSAALSGDTLYIGDYGGRLLALDPATGSTRWVRSVDGRVYGTPAVAGGRVFVPSSTGNSLTAFSLDGRRLWKVETGGYVYSSPAVWGGTVFFGSYDGHLYAVSAATGARRFALAAGGPVSGAAVVVGGVAYAGSTWGRITGVDARTGEVLLRFPHGEYVPVSGNGGRLLLHGYSRVYAVEPVSRRRS
jgi:outer membrane protein assembly factor BamB